MTRKKYHNPVNQTKYVNSEVSQEEDRRLQALFDEEQLETLKNQETFAFQNMEMLLNIYFDIFDGVFFHECTMENMCDFIECPEHCDHIMKDLDEHDVLHWVLQNKAELANCYAALMEYELVECTVRQWSIFCYCMCSGN
jgi:hypothetical protein